MPLQNPVMASAKASTKVDDKAGSKNDGTYEIRQPKVVVKGADMPDEMLKDAIEIAVAALDRFELERDMAKYMKKEFDRRYQPTWHCIVGRHFGSYVSHETSGFAYFYIDKLAVLLFRSGDTE